MITIPTSRPSFTQQEIEQITQNIGMVLTSGHLTMGPWIERFEEAFAAQTGTRFAIATNSGTSTLEILLRYYGAAGREVIVPTNTFSASANAVIAAGGTPVLIDIAQETLQPNLEHIRAAHSGKTAGIVIVHIAGFIAPDIFQIRDYCRRHGLFLIEDAAHAAGASRDHTRAGNWGDGGSFSFFPTKPMTTGEGGAITTNDPDCAAFARSVRCHGIDAENKSLFVRYGHNFRMSEITAVIGYYQNARLDTMNAARRTIAAAYQRSLDGNELVRPLPWDTTDGHAFYKYPVVLPTKDLSDRFRDILKREFSIATGTIYWPPVHMQPFYQETFGYRPEDLPCALDTLARTVALPVYPDMTDSDTRHVTTAIEATTEKIA